MHVNAHVYMYMHITCMYYNTNFTNYSQLLSVYLTKLYMYTVLILGRGDGERYVTCIKVVQEVLPIALARPYSRYVLPPGTKVRWLCSVILGHMYTGALTLCSVHEL